MDQNASSVLMMDNLTIINLKLRELDTNLQNKLHERYPIAISLTMSLQTVDFLQRVSQVGDTSEIIAMLVKLVYVLTVSKDSDSESFEYLNAGSLKFAK